MEPTVLRSITINVMNNGSVSVSGHIEDKMTALGMLEVAKDSIIKHCDKLANNPDRIVAPPPGLAGMLRQP